MDINKSLELINQIVAEMLNADTKTNVVKLAEIIGEGGEGIVCVGTYEPVKNSQIMLDVVIKIPKKKVYKTEKKRESESEIMNKLGESPFLPQFICLTANNDLVLGYCSKGSLKDLIKQSEPIMRVNRYNIASDIAEALFYLHSKGWVHRDVKSENIFISGDWRGVLGDLGLATLITQQKRNVGSLPYVPPETHDKMLSLDGGKRDIYNFGLILLELFSHTWSMCDVHGNKKYFDELDKKNLNKREIEKKLTLFFTDINQGTWESNIKNILSCNPINLFPRDILQLIQSCLTYKPSARPDASEVCNRISKIRDKHMGFFRKAKSGDNSKNDSSADSSAHLEHVITTGIGLDT